ncbi:MAG: hypothetical protein DBY40_02600 [Clostridiales bacterium]|nr:MAG: hypothetical protein DBY40_02600 [Clostridiales bacterium]
MDAALHTAASHFFTGGAENAVAGWPRRGMPDACRRRGRINAVPRRTYAAAYASAPPRKRCGDAAAESAVSAEGGSPHRSRTGAADAAQPPIQIHPKGPTP